MKNNQGRRLILVLLASFLFLVLFQDFLHNHPLDFHDHANCPVYQLQQTVNSSPHSCINLTAILLVVLFIFTLSNPKHISRLPITGKSNRGPPLNFFH